MKEKYDITTESEFKSYFHQMLNLDDLKIRRISSISEDDFSGGGAFKAVSAFFDSSKYNNSAQETILHLKQEFLRTGKIEDNEYKRFIVEVLDPEIAEKANECMKLNYDATYDARQQEIEAQQQVLQHQLDLARIELDVAEYEKLKDNGFYIEITGNVESEFVLKLGWMPPNYASSPTKVSSIFSNSLKKVGAIRFHENTIIHPGDEIQQHVVRISDDEGFVTFSVKGYPSDLELKIPSRGGGAFPIGTIIASNLTFSQFSYETRNNPTGEYDSRQSKWAPADGRKVEGSYYSRYHPHVPDLRGQFLRGFNVMDIGVNQNYRNGKDENDRRLIDEYSYQGAEIGIHQHTITVSGKTSKNGSHTHAAAGKHSHDLNNNLLGYSGDSAGQSNQANKHGKPVGSKHRTGDSGNHKHPSAGDHRHSISISGTTDKSGSTETTVKNLAVYYYVRINL
ncbi:hypothetical protein [Halocola ammonii]